METMKTVYVAAHGKAPHSGTYNPSGMRVLFYAEDESMDEDVCLLILAGGPVAQLSPGDEAGTLPNQMLSAHDDYTVNQIRMVSDGRGIDCRIVGRDIPGPVALCETPDVCTGKHSCDGVLGQMQREGVTELHILACSPPYAGQQEAEVERQEKQIINQDWDAAWRCYDAQDWEAMNTFWESLTDDRRRVLKASAPEFRNMELDLANRLYLLRVGDDAFYAYYCTLQDGDKEMVLGCDDLAEVIESFEAGSESADPSHGPDNSDSEDSGSTAYYTPQGSDDETAG